MGKNATPRCMKSLDPVIKWVGGKRQLLPEILPLIPDKFDRYFEPFIGGGAVAFALSDRLPRAVTIGDINPELVNFYKIIRQCPNEFLEVIQSYQEQNCKEFYLHVRGLDRGDGFAALSSFTRAARFYYLVKCGFNGLWRVNQKGFHNVPYAGDKSPGWSIVDRENLLAVSSIMQSWSIANGDFEETIAAAGNGDFVYLDPPYAPVSTTSDFTSYSKEGFGEAEQTRLADCLDRLTDKGVKFLLSNSDTELTRSLYQRYKIKTVGARRNINSVGSKRGNVNEILVRNF